MSDVQEKAKKWLSSQIDDEAREEIQNLLEDPDALSEAFYKDLEFGTGGLRGIMGMGSNRMNKYTVGMATQGLANYLLGQFPDLDEIKVAIAHDSRNNSRFFAEVTANVFAANGIRVYLFEELRPTPELSFAIRHLKCQSGVVLTASHNPKEYNGYKAYWDDGAQMVSPHDKNVIAEVGKIESIDEVKWNGGEDMIESIGEEVDKAYLDELLSLSLSPEAVKKENDLKIVFSPIHGTGITLVPKALKQMGFTNVMVVEAQATPDGNFPTVIYPNPEEADALKLALDKARETDADLVMATDPDADRVGIACRNLQGEFTLLNGNQTGALLIYYALKRWKDNGKLDGDQFIVKTIVTTDLIHRIADHFDVTHYDTLTGFKYIASIIRDLEGEKQFIAGGEESYGYLIGDFVRDKDAVASCAMIAEMCAWAKTQGMSIYELLIDLYSRFGFYKEHLISLTKKGMKGAEEIREMMANFRENPPEELGGSKVVRLIDYQASTDRNLKKGTEDSIDFEKSNVLQFITEDDYKISARPSGTEPKIKFYMSVHQPLEKKEDFEQVSEKLDNILSSLESDLMNR